MSELSLSHCKYECKYHVVFAPKFQCRFVKHMRQKISEANRLGYSQVSTAWENANLRGA